MTTTAVSRTAAAPTAAKAVSATAAALDRLATAEVLFLNWRDPTHPQAGGAETYCYEIARRFRDAGAGVTLFTARHPGSTPYAESDGVRIVRRGGTFGVYPAAAHHLLRHRHAYDAVIDFQNGIPFFSPLFTRRRTADICVIHHVHQRQFDVRFRWPLNLVGRVLEKHAGRLAYRGRPVVVVSPSTREGVRRELGLANPIHIVPNGCPALATPATPVPVAAAPASSRDARDAPPRIAVVSRLVPQKRIDLLVRAVPALLERLPDLRVDICGDGEELARLRALAERLGVGAAVRFHGHVTESRKAGLLAGARLTVVPSMAEGWGLTVIEANGAGVPAVAFDVPGLRDAIRHGHTGWLLPPGTDLAADLAAGVAAALDELRDPAVRERMAAACREWSSAFSWDESAERLAAVVVGELRRLRGPRGLPALGGLRGHRRSRRSTSDLTVDLRFRAADPDDMERRFGRCLRGTDAWRRDGDVFRVLLHGCDEVRALRVLRRLGVPEHAVVCTRLATRQDVLTGARGPR